jgi:hypothetical protein
MLHMDIWGQNFLVGSSGTVIGLVDFDRAEGRRGAEVHADPDLAAQRPGRRDTLPAAQLGPSDGVGLIVRHGRKGELQEPHFLQNTLC